MEGYVNSGLRIKRLENTQEIKEILVELGESAVS